MKNRYLFLILCTTSFFFAEMAKYLLDVNSLIYENLSQQLTFEQLEETFAAVRKWQLLGYFLMPVTLFIKISLISGVLSIGAFIFDKDINYKKLWRIVVTAEFIFLLPSILKIMWFYFFQTGATLEDMEVFYPFSLLNFFNLNEVSLWYLYPLQTINLFEIIYCILLAFLLDRLIKERNNHDGIKIVLASYIPALVIWMVSIMFLILNNS